MPAGKLVADITVCHGFFVDEFARQLGTPTEVLCGYCSITSYKLKVNETGAVDLSVISTANSSHVKTWE